MRFFGFAFLLMLAFGANTRCYSQTQAYDLLDSPLVIDASNRNMAGSDDMINRYAADLERSVLYVIDSSRILGLNAQTLKEINRLDIQSRYVVSDSSSSTGVRTIVWVRTKKGTGSRSRHKAP